MGLWYKNRRLHFLRVILNIQHLAVNNFGRQTSAPACQFGAV
jgi:hypothetical protein